MVPVPTDLCVWRFTCIQWSTVKEGDKSLFKLVKWCHQFCSVHYVTRKFTWMHFEDQSLKQNSAWDKFVPKFVPFSCWTEKENSFSGCCWKWIGGVSFQKGTDIWMRLHSHRTAFVLTFFFGILLDKIWSSKYRVNSLVLRVRAPTLQLLWHQVVCFVVDIAWAWSAYR